MIVVQLGATGASGTQDCTGTLLVVFVLHAVAVQLLPAVAAELVQLATGVGPTTMGAGQVVAVQLLFTLASAGAQLPVGTLEFEIVVQVIPINPFDELAVCGVHAEVGVGPVAALMQVVVVYWLSLVGPDAVQLAT